MDGVYPFECPKPIAALEQIVKLERMAQPGPISKIGTGVGRADSTFHPHCIGLSAPYTQYHRNAE